MYGATAPDGSLDERWCNRTSYAYTGVAVMLLVGQYILDQTPATSEGE